ncbi:polysaccharide deacetylase family protein [Alicyclobacillus dauci]|uniref:Polysaccharide deacetylase family protein n=1 Tax=Alicyclobacillus dauci TaxID=1475485 RepID=A0ABY6YX12_9BACL|nr:polysaccharide deacetylase family protein [Alicyclobacillus dauci]WAH35104.1 polysaccharide deacetylase family protein [Alicyclobacillus dauci]
MQRVFLLMTALLLVCGLSIPEVGAKKKDRFYFERLGYAHWEFPVDKKVIALTFDDGPDPIYTPQVLELLSAYHQHATFFLIGRKVKQYPQIARDTALLGNELGNHTYTHRHVARMTESELIQELNETHDEIQRATGEDTKYFRPPRGFYDERSVLTAYRHGYPVVLWSWDEDSRDWEAPGVHNIVKTVMSHIDPGDIVLFHDGTGNSKQTISALKIILPALQERGYQCITISEMSRLSRAAANAAHK